MRDEAAALARCPGRDASLRRRRWLQLVTLPWLGVVLGGLCACTGPKEVPVQSAKVGDPLVQAEGTRVELALAFQPGVSNGLYKGAVRLFGPEHPSAGSLHALNAVCSLRDTPGWPAYDNLYGYPIEAVEQARALSGRTRWQILYHFDGRIEGKGAVKPQAWTARLKDNLCRRGDFDDSRARKASAT